MDIIRNLFHSIGKDPVIEFKEFFNSNVENVRKYFCFYVEKFEDQDPLIEGCFRSLLPFRPEADNQAALFAECRKKTEGMAIIEPKMSGSFQERSEKTQEFKEKYLSDFNDLLIVAKGWPDSLKLTFYLLLFDDPGISRIFGFSASEWESRIELLKAFIEKFDLKPL